MLIVFILVTNRMTVEFSMMNNLTMVNRLVIVLEKFCLSSNPNTRKGGLIGLAAVMVGFKNGADTEPPPEVVEEVVRPILTCFLDSDSKVRYFACESLYNVTKVARANILPLFGAIFDNLAKIVCDPDPGVRTGSELMDRLLKDIVIEQQTIDIQCFLPKFEEYLYTNNPFTRMFIISWIRILDSNRIVDMIKYLPSILDGIFNCLNDSTVEIRASTVSLLSEFLNKIVSSPTDSGFVQSIINIILKHVKNDNEDAQYTAIAWLRTMIRLLEDQDLINFTPTILAAILPCLALQPTLSSTTDEIGSSNLPSQMGDLHISSSANRSNICEMSSIVNSNLIDEVTRILVERRNTQASESATADLEPIFEALIKELQKQGHPVIKLTILDWLRKLKNAEPNIILTTSLDQKLFQIILETLFDRSDAVVKSALRVIADLFCFDSPDGQQVGASTTGQSDEATIKDDPTSSNAPEIDKKRSILSSKASSLPRPTAKKVAIATATETQSTNANINRFIQSLYKTFCDKENVFEDRGTFVILNLCVMIKPETIYRSFAEILKDEKNDTKFAYNLVQKLNQILLTTQPLYSLRTRLSNEDEPEVAALFQVLYHAWCHSSVAALTICLLTNNYRQASELVAKLSQADINVEILAQIDWVVQLIESPVFSSLRMRLLDSNNNQYLLQSLFGLLMILPQSEAYKRLANRLDQAYKYMCMQSQGRHQSITQSTGGSSSAGGLNRK